MSKDLYSRTTGGKGNVNMFIERDPKICAAGLPNLDDVSVSNTLSSYKLNDHVDALLHDTIIPKKSYDPQISKKRDMRNAGMFTESSDLINPPNKTKFELLVEDFKNTARNSYWRMDVGKVPDPKGNLPEGLDINATTMGKKYPTDVSAYEVIFPTRSIEDQVPRSKRCGIQTQRNYCSFNANQCFGMKANVDSSSKRMQCCLTDDKIYVGNSLRKPIHILQARFNDKNLPRLGETKDPNNNINCVPEGFAFGKIKQSECDGVAECLTTCELNPERKLLKKCLTHLNTLRKCMSKRFDGAFYPKFYLEVKYLDTSKTGWLPKGIIYDICKKKYIRFNEQLLEPLMLIWCILDESRIEYKEFIKMLNYREAVLDLPKVSDIPNQCIDFRTTYSEMCRDNVENIHTYRAGVPSGRYFDKDYPITPDGLCRADRVYLPQESDAKSCLSPSILTLYGVSHRDMYAKRDAKTIRTVFENIGGKFTDDSFHSVWQKAQKYHSHGWVSYETFRRALE